MNRSTKSMINGCITRRSSGAGKIIRHRNNFDERDVRTTSALWSSQISIVRASVIQCSSTMEGVRKQTCVIRHLEDIEVWKQETKPRPQTESSNKKSQNCPTPPLGAWTRTWDFRDVMRVLHHQSVSWWVGAVRNNRRKCASIRKPSDILIITIQIMSWLVTSLSSWIFTTKNQFRYLS